MKAALRIVSEILLWIVANVVCVVIPTYLGWFVATEVLHLGRVTGTIYVTGLALATLTWGSWAALTWTQTRFLRVAMRGSTVIPGLILTALGIMVAKSGLGLLPGVLIVAAGFGGIVVANVLSKTLGASAAKHTGIGIAVGLVGFPIIASLMAIGVGTLWVQFVVEHVNEFSGCLAYSRPLDLEIARLISLPKVMVTVLSWTIVSAIVPAIASSISQRACRVLGF